MKRYLLPVFGLAVVLVLLLMPVLTGADQQPEKKAWLQGELKVGERFWFIRAGESYVERGFPGKVLAIDGDWVKVEEINLLGENRTMWINLKHVGAIWKATPVENDE